MFHFNLSDISTREETTENNTEDSNDVGGSRVDSVAQGNPSESSIFLDANYEDLIIDDTAKKIFSDELELQLKQVAPEVTVSEILPAKEGKIQATLHGTKDQVLLAKHFLAPTGVSLPSFGHLDFFEPEPSNPNEEISQDFDENIDEHFTQSETLKSALTSRSSQIKFNIAESAKPTSIIDIAQSSNKIEEEVSLIQKKESNMDNDEDDSSSFESHELFTHAPRIRKGGSWSLICIIMVASMLIALMLEVIKDVDHDGYRYTALISALLALICVCSYPCFYLCGSVHCTYYECVNRFHVGYMLLVVCSLVSFSCLTAFAMYRGLDEEFRDYFLNECTIINVKEKDSNGPTYYGCYSDIDVFYEIPTNNCTVKMFTAQHVHSIRRSADCDHDWQRNLKYSCFTHPEKCADAIQDTKTPHCDVDYANGFYRNCANLEFLTILFGSAAAVILVILCVIEHYHQGAPRKEIVEEHHVIVVDHKTQRQRPPDMDELQFILRKIESIERDKDSNGRVKKVIVQKEDDIMEELEHQMEEECRLIEEAEKKSLAKASDEIVQIASEKRPSISNNPVIELQTMQKPSPILNQKSDVLKQPSRNFDNISEQTKMRENVEPMRVAYDSDTEEKTMEVIVKHGNPRSQEKPFKRTPDRRLKNESDLSIGTFNEDISESPERPDVTYREDSMEFIAQPKRTPRKSEEQKRKRDRYHEYYPPRKRRSNSPEAPSRRRRGTSPDDQRRRRHRKEPRRRRNSSPRDRRSPPPHRKRRERHDDRRRHSPRRRRPDRRRRKKKKKRREPMPEMNPYSFPPHPPYPMFPPSFPGAFSPDHPDTEFARAMKFAGLEDVVDPALYSLPPPPPFFPSEPYFGWQRR